MWSTAEVALAMKATRAEPAVHQELVEDPTVRVLVLRAAMSTAKVSITRRTIPQDCQRAFAISVDQELGDAVECLWPWRRDYAARGSFALSRAWGMPTAQCSGHLRPERRRPAFPERHRSGSRGWTSESLKKNGASKVHWCTLKHETRTVAFVFCFQ